jgi:hypothetical protein
MAVEAPRARFDGSPMRELRDCLLALQADGAPAGVYDYTDGANQWKYAYYLRQPGWNTSESGNTERLANRLLVPAVQRPAFATRGQLATLAGTLPPERARELDVVHRVVFDDDRMLLLPGVFGACRDVHGAGVVAEK